MGRIDIDWIDVFSNQRSPDRDAEVCFVPPSAAATRTRTRALGVAEALSGDGRRRRSPDSHHRKRFGTLRDDIDRRVDERRSAAHGGDVARRPVTRAAAKAADGRRHDAHSTSKGVFDFSLEDEEAERKSNRFCPRLPPIQKSNYGPLPLDKVSQGRAGKRDPISVDKMYSSQPSSTSLSAKRTHAIDPEVSDHEKCQKIESSIPRRFSKRRKEQLQNLSSVYSRKVQDVVLLDDEDIQPEEEVNCEMSDRRNETKIYYPSRDNRESVELTRSDIKCLDPGVYLSSPVINFYIQYIERNRLCSQDIRDKFYIFNTYFYGKLEEALYRPDEFSKLRRWWKGVNILNKAYIILPIHGTAHWSLVIICIPAKESVSGPIILHLDSLAMHPSTKILNTVERYLEKEWHQLSSILGTTWEDLKSNIHKKSVEVPRQNNEYDCGIFMLYYIERFIEEAPESFTIDKLDMFNRSWFKPEEASDLRQRIRELLLEEFESARLDDALSGADASERDDSIKNGELEADAPSDSSEMVVEVVGGLGNTVKSNEGIKVVASEQANGESGDAGKSTEGIVAASVEKSIEGINVAEPEEASEECRDACKSIGGINVAANEASGEFGETGNINKGTKVAVSEGASVSGYTDKSIEDISDSEVAVLDKAPTSSYKRRKKTTSGEPVDAGKSIEGINVAEPEEASEDSRDACKRIGGINVSESDEASGEIGEACKSMTNKGTKVAVSEGATVESGYADKIMEDISDSEVAVLDKAPTSSYNREKTTACVLSVAASFSDSVKDEEGSVKADSGCSKAEKEGDLIVIVSPERSVGNDEIIGSSRIPDVVCDSCDSDTDATVRIVRVRKRNCFPSYGCSN